MEKLKKRQRSRSREPGEEPVTNKELLKRMKRLEKMLEEKATLGIPRQSRSPGPSCTRDHESKRRRYRSRSRSLPRQSHSRENRHRLVEDSGAVTHRTSTASLSIKRTRASLSSGSSVASLSPRLSATSLSPYRRENTGTRSDSRNSNIESTVPTITRSHTAVRSPDVSNWGQEDQSLILHEEVVLPDDLTDVLGDDIAHKPPPSENLHHAIAVRWGHIIGQGLSKETENTLLQRYGVAESCKQLCPPLLNPEIETILTNDRTARDNFNREIQTHIGKALSAMGRSMTLLLNDAEKIPRKLRDDILAPLGDSGRLLSNLVHNITLSRKNLITPTLNKGVKEVMEKTIPSEYLFGSDIAERIKAAKSLQSTGKELRLATPYFPQIQRGHTRGGGSHSQRTSRPHQVPSRVLQPLNRQRPARRQGETRPMRGQPFKDPRVDRFKRKR